MLGYYYYSYLQTKYTYSPSTFAYRQKQPQTKMSNGSYWQSSIGKEFLSDPEGFKRKRQNREYTAKEKKELNYLNLSKQDVTETSFLEKEWDHMPRTKLSNELTHVYNEYFKHLVDDNKRITQAEAIKILQKASSSNACRTNNRICTGPSVRI